MSAKKKTVRKPKSSMPARDKHYVRASKEFNEHIDQAAMLLGVPKAALWNLGLTMLLAKLAPALVLGGIDQKTVRSQLREEFDSSLG